MKYILIILSILLLSFPLLGQTKETGVLYPWKTSSGYGWKTFGDGNLQPQYKGEISNGKPDGLGILYNGVYLKRFYFYPKIKFIGEWKNVEKHGQGTKDVKMDDQGTLDLPNGEMYLGKFKDGFPNGLGILFYGVYLKRFHFCPKVKFIGEWENGEIHGQGTLNLPNGEKYVVAFNDGGNTW